MIRRVIIIVILACVALLINAPYSEADNSPGINDRYSRLIVVSKVVEALGKIGDIRAHDVLTEAVRSREFFIRANAAQALGRIGDKESVPLLRNLINDENYLVRVLAVAALFELGQEDTKGPLLGFLRDNDPAVRAAAAEEIGRLVFEIEDNAGGWKEKFLSILNDMLPLEEDPVVRVKLIEQLGGYRFNAAVEHINQSMNDADPDVRRVACWAAGEIGDKSSIPFLLERLGDEDVEVRSKAKISLAEMGERQLIKLFWNDVEEEDPYLRVSSYVALATLKEVDILPILLEAVVNPDNPAFVKADTAWALSILKPYLSDLIQEALLSSKNKHKRLLSDNLRIRYEVNDKELMSVFINALQNKDDPLHEDAPIVFQGFYDEISLPALREALWQDDPDFVAATAYTLGELRDKGAFDNLVRVFRRYGI